MAATKNTEISAAELEIKRRGRRRLIGAIAIGLLAVVFLPMIFDPEPKRDVQGKQEISIQLPDKEKAPPLPAPVAPATPTAAPSTAPAATSQAAPPAAAPVATPATPVVAAPAPVEKAPAAPAKDKPAPAKDKPAPAERSAPAAPTKAKPAPKEAPSPAVGGFAVQVAALKDAEHAKQLVAKLKDMKLPVSTDTVAVNGGKVTRIRVGPYADKAKAESVLAEIKLSGIDGGKVIPLKP